jgi:hypothetical protein
MQLRVLPTFAMFQYFKREQCNRSNQIDTKIRDIG